MAPKLSADFTIDVHTHPIPQFYREALVDAGFPFDGKTLIIDGYPTPEWDIDWYLENRARHGYDYSVMSITAPGVSFLHGNNKAKNLARQLNDQLHEWTTAHPESLGAVAVLPLPHVSASLKEVAYCLDELHLEGIGLYTQCEGLYLGDPFYDPIFTELDRRAATVFVHPVAPEPEVKLKGVCSPAIEYPFDTTRAIANLSFTGSRKRYPNIKFIFSHGGGTLPFLADRIVGMASLPFQGGRNPAEVIRELKGYYFDLAGVTSAPQLAALDAFVGSSQLVSGSDVPYFPSTFLPVAQATVNNYPGFSEEDQRKIRHENALSLFPRIVEKLSSQKARTEVVIESALPSQ